MQAMLEALEAMLLTVAVPLELEMLRQMRLQQRERMELISVMPLLHKSWLKEAYDYYVLVYLFGVIVVKS
jgi:hypothetical protein